MGLNSSLARLQWFKVMKNFLVAIFLGILATQITTSFQSTPDLGTIKSRHNLFKSVFGDLDDQIVATGLISDKKLHEIGAIFGLCYPDPEAIDYSK